MDREMASGDFSTYGGGGGGESFKGTGGGGKSINKGVQFIDISYQMFGKYTHCTKYKGLWYADCDMALGKPKEGAIPAPGQATQTPFKSDSLVPKKQGPHAGALELRERERWLIVALRKVKELFISSQNGH